MSTGTLTSPSIASTPADVSEHRDRAPCHRIGDVAPAVRRRPGQRREQVAGLRILAPQCHPGDLHVRHRPAAGGHGLRLLSQPPQHLADGMVGTQVHGLDTVPAWLWLSPRKLGPQPRSVGLKRQRRTRVG